MALAGNGVLDTFNALLGQLYDSIDMKFSLRVSMICHTPCLSPPREVMHEQQVLAL